MSDYRYCLPLDVWVGDDHLIDARDMPDELRPEDHVELVEVRLVRDDAGQVVGALVWEVEWPDPADPSTWPELTPLPGRWVPIA